MEEKSGDKWTGEMNARRKSECSLFPEHSFSGEWGADMSGGGREKWPCSPRNEERGESLFF